MTEFTLSATLDAPYDAAVQQVRDGLTDAGFGVLTEIDLKATLKKKLDVDVAPKIILGACRPQLAHQALQAEPRVSVLLPCNVVVTALSADESLVEIMDPGIMEEFTGNADLGPVATEARTRLSDMLEALTAQK